MGAGRNTMAFDTFFASEFLVINEHHCGIKKKGKSQRPKQDTRAVDEYKILAACRSTKSVSEEYW